MKNYFSHHAAAKPINPFNPFQAVQTQQQQQPPQQQHQQSYQNWTFPDNQTNFNGFGSPPLGTNGFFYTSNMTNGIISQPSAFGGKTVFGNPFMVSVLSEKNHWMMLNGVDRRSSLRDNVDLKGCEAWGKC